MSNLHHDREARIEPSFNSLNAYVSPVLVKLDLDRTATGSGTSSDAGAQSTSNVV